MQPFGREGGGEVASETGVWKHYPILQLLYFVQTEDFYLQDLRCVHHAGDVEGEVRYGPGGLVGGLAVVGAVVRQAGVPDDELAPRLRPGYLVPPGDPAPSPQLLVQLHPLLVALNLVRGEDDRGGLVGRAGGRGGARLGPLTEVRTELEQEQNPLKDLPREQIELVRCNSLGVRCKWVPKHGKLIVSSRRRRSRVALCTIICLAAG